MERMKRPENRSLIDPQEIEVELKTRLTFQQVALDNLQHEMAYEAAVLERLEKKVGQ